MKIKAEKVKVVLGIIVAIIAIVGSLLSALRYFATRKEVGLIRERQDLSIHDDRVFQQRQDVERMKQQSVFERRTDSATAPEKEMIKIGEDRLRELERQRNEKIDEYKQKER